MDKRRNTMVCPHNEGCACTEAQRQCWKCGWHPEVAQRRLDNAMKKMEAKETWARKMLSWRS